MDRPTPDCIDDADATSFVEGLLSERDIERVESHVDQCPDCRQHLVLMVRAHGSAPPSSEPDRRLLSHGTVLGRYEIRRVVGLGAMGIVYAAYDEQLRRDVALKVLRAHGNQDRLLREAHALARLRHPNVVTVHDVGTADDRVFIVMELVDGVTLAEWLRAPRRLVEIVELFVQAGRGLAAAHAAGLVHRDFKPDNVLVGTDGRACVTDFGLARGSEATTDPIAPSGSTTATRSGALVGTPVYMAPEQHLRRESDARSDQFAFCVALYEALYRTRPFRGDDLEELARNVTSGTLSRTPADRHIPRRLARIVARGLATSPHDRYPSMTVVVDALLAARRSRIPIAVAAVAVAAVIGTTAIAMRAHAPADTCVASAMLVDEVWNPFDRTAQIVRFAALRPREIAMIEASARLVDDWSAAWRLERRAACSDDKQHAVRLGCLDQRLGELRAQLAVWRTGDAEVADRALAAASALPKPDDCAAHPGAAGDPAMAERIAHVRALARAGQHARAKAELPPLLSLVEASRNAGDVAGALVASGDVEHATGDLELARTHLSRAAREAARASDDALLFAALVGEAHVVIDQGRPLDSLGLVNAAEALAMRAGLDRTETVARTRGAALTAAGRLGEAIAELERALAAVEARATRDPTARADIAAVLGGLAAARTQQFEYAAAHDLLVRTLAIEQTIYGGDHPELAKTLHDLGNSEARLGEFDDALAHLHRAREILVAAYGEHHLLVGTADLSLANVLGQQGRLADARAQYEHARATLTAILPAEHETMAAVEEGLAVVLGQMDDCKAAIPHHERAITIRDRIGRGGPSLANELVNLGACLSDVGRNADARATLERALAALDAAGLSELEHAQAWMILADLDYREGHRAKAIATTRKIVALTAGIDRPDVAAIHTFATQALAEWAP